MNRYDPFQALGGERTIIKPRLGRPVPAQAASMDTLADWPEKQPSQDATEDPRFDELLLCFQACPPASMNILVVLATPLLRLMNTAGRTAQLQSTALLASTLAKALQEMDRSLAALQRPHTERLAVRYVLCTFLDERAACTPWGGNGQWAPQSLLHHFFSETWGGEKVFLVVRKMLQEPAENRDVLELVSILLSLGFQGKYKVEPGGELALEQLRIRLLQLFENPAVHPSTQLHPGFWQSKAPAENRRLMLIPLWLPVTALCMLATLVFLGLHFNMNNQSDYAFNQIAAISLPEAALGVTGAQARTPVAGLELPMQLQQEIISGMLTLKQRGNRSTVVLVGDGLFNSGSAELVPDARNLVDKVARELARHPGQITVTGYTDNQPIRSIRFPSNWQLAAARAEHVGQRISALLPGIQVMTEGAGSANPIAPNDTPQGRAMNRRVEITLVHSH